MKMVTLNIIWKKLVLFRKKGPSIQTSLPLSLSLSLSLLTLAQTLHGKIMGVIENGTVSGELPSNEAFAVHYPGYPSSTSRAVDSLGGAQALLKARTSPSNKLELRFRPDDPYSHPAFGELRPCNNNFLLKISKTQSIEQNSDAELAADIVARVPQAYHFEGFSLSSFFNFSIRTLNLLIMPSNFDLFAFTSLKFSLFSFQYFV